jgi:hypothetical protein
VNTIGSLTVNGDAMLFGPSAHLTHTIQNTQLGGYTSIYMESVSGASAEEEAQIFTGGGAGLNLRTNTAHPIKFTTNNVPGVNATASMQILANTTRDVEILAPLKVKGPTTTIDNNLTVGGDLLIGTTNVSTALGEKATTATTDNSAVAWSEGLAGAGYHYLKTGTDALVVRSNSGAISANFLGNAGGPAYDGKVIFYKNFDVQGSQTVTGGLTVNGAASTFTGTLNAPLIKTGRITAAAGVRESGLAWTGIIAMNTLGEYFFY